MRVDSTGDPLVLSVQFQNGFALLDVEIRTPLPPEAAFVGDAHLYQGFARLGSQRLLRSVAVVEHDAP